MAWCSVKNAESVYYVQVLRIISGICCRSSKNRFDAASLNIIYIAE